MLVEHILEHTDHLLINHNGSRAKRIQDVIYRSHTEIELQLTDRLFWGGIKSCVVVVAKMNLDRHVPPQLMPRQFHCGVV